MVTVWIQTAIALVFTVVALGGFFLHLVKGEYLVAVMWLFGFLTIAKVSAPDPEQLETLRQFRELSDK